MKIDEVKKDFNLKKKSGIYLIFCVPTVKGYIGSSINLYARLTEHLVNFRHNRHQNKYLQNAWNKYEKSDFEIFIIEYCNKDLLFEKEQFYVNLYKTSYKENGYNLACVQKGNFGYSFTEEQRKKVSDGIKKKLEDINYKKARQAKIAEYIRSEEGRKKRSEITKEMWKDEEIRAKITESLNNPSPDDKRLKDNLDPITLANKKEKLSVASKEQWSDPVNRQLMSEIKKDQYENNPELKKKISETTAMAMNAPEMKEKISIAMKKFNAENPERVAEIKEARLKTFATEEYKEASSHRSKELWQDPNHRAKILDARKDMYTDEVKAKMSAKSQAFWDDPVKARELMIKRSKITQEQFEQLKALHKLNYSNPQIAKILNCKISTVARIRRGDSKLFAIV